MSVHLIERHLCYACNDTLEPLRESRAWQVEVGRCRSCSTISVIGSEEVVAEDLAKVSSTNQTDWDAYADVMHLTDTFRADVLTELRARIATGSPTPTLFDVGAGTGAFLDMARRHGYAIRGNDISASAIEYAAEHFGIELSSDDVAQQPRGAVDAITMWCVLAHVGQPRDFLGHARDMLRPGGVLFLRTPRLSAVDVVSEAAAQMTSGRLARVADQRVTRGHLHLFSDAGMRDMLTGLGFVDIDIRPAVHAGCTGQEIASRLGGPAGWQRLSARAIDRAVSRGVGPRNAMFVYARKAPAEA
ncbi:class I SAM-dependent methyltransferase [Nocardioides ultimimeridianus]